MYIASTLTQADDGGRRSDDGGGGDGGGDCIATEHILKPPSEYERDSSIPESVMKPTEADMTAMKNFPWHR